MRLLTSRFFIYLHALLGKNSLYTFHGEKLLKWIVDDRRQSTSPALSLLFASPWHKVVRPLHVEQSTLQRLGLVQLDDKGSALRPAATFSNAGHSLEDHPPLVYGADAPRLDSLHSSSMKREKAITSGEDWTTEQGGHENQL